MAELRKQESVDDTKKIVHTYPLLRVSQVWRGEAHLLLNYQLSHLMLYTLGKGRGFCWNQGKESETRMEEVSVNSWQIHT